MTLADPVASLRAIGGNHVVAVGRESRLHHRCGEALNAVACYVDGIDVLVNGVYYTIEAGLPALLEHGEGMVRAERSSSPAPRPD
jgi:hypothetical protein